MSTCAVCVNTSPCFRCEIKSLKKLVEQQSIELRYWKGESSKLLQLKKDYRTFFETSNNFQNLSYVGDNIDYKFLTITFDPKKFGLYNVNSDEQNYILKQLLRLIKAGKIKSLSGCFEYQKNGTTHAHLICRISTNNKDIEDTLKPYFTDDPKNKYAIKCEDPNSIANITKYITKESTEYYRYDTSLPLDIDPINYEEPQKEKQENSSNDLTIKKIKILEQEIKNIQSRIDQYKKNLLSRHAEIVNFF